jgi:hypothetical protein
MPGRPHPDAPPIAAPSPAPRRWLLFIHQFPSRPSHLRVSTWRRLQQLGAIPLKQAVYVLPETPEAREDLEWLKTEAKNAGGEATILIGQNLDSWADDALVEEFRRARQGAYDELARDVEASVQRASGARRSRGARAPAVGRLLDIYRARLATIDRVDFFGSAGRDRVLMFMRQLEQRGAKPSISAPLTTSGEVSDVQARLWVTRPRPGVDRMASAWLIRRFIDREARFGFALDRQLVPADAIPFDMFGVEFSHQGEGCTFETLCSVFKLAEPALARIAAIVHDLDLKDARYGAPECTTVGTMIEGLQLACQDDDVLLAQGMTLFESLYRSFQQAGRSAGPRPLARPRRAGNRAGAARRRRESNR